MPSTASGRPAGRTSWRAFDTWYPGFRGLRMVARPPDTAPARVGRAWPRSCSGWRAWRRFSEVGRAGTDSLVGHPGPVILPLKGEKAVDRGDRQAVTAG